MYRKWLSMILAALMSLGLSVPALAEGEPAPADWEAVEYTGPAEDPAASGEGAPATAAGEAPAGEDVSPAAGEPTAVSTGYVLPDGGVAVTINGPMDVVESVSFWAPGGGMYDNLYNILRDGLYYVPVDASVEKLSGERPTQMHVYPGTELVFIMDPSYDVTIDGGSFLDNSFYYGSPTIDAPLEATDRKVNVQAPDSGSLTITIAPMSGSLPRQIPMTGYGMNDGWMSWNTEWGVNSYWDDLGGGVISGSVTTGGKIAIEVQAGYTAEVLKGGAVTRVGSYNYPTLDKTSVGVDMAVDPNAEEFVFAIVRQGEHFTAPETGAVSPAGGTFADVDAGVWYADPIQKAYSSGIVKGVTEDTFRPNGATTRGQTVTMLYRAMGSPAAGAVFSDTIGEVGSAAGWAAASGVTTGVSDTAFDPGSSVTREQLVTMLYRLAGSPAADSGPLASYADGGAVQSYARDAVAWALSGGLLTGYEDGTIRPAATASRAEVCALIVRYLGM